MTEVVHESCERSTDFVKCQKDNYLRVPIWEIYCIGTFFRMQGFS